MTEQTTQPDSNNDEQGITARLKEFAEFKGNEPPATILDNDGAPTKELLSY